VRAGGRGLPRAWLLALLPGGVGVLLALALGLSHYRSWRLTIELPWFVGGVGLGMSSLIVAGLVWWQRERRARERIASLHEATADDRRRLLQRLDHELKNPLTAIRAGVANITEAPGENPQAFGSVVAQTDRLSRLAADLRKLGELETRVLERAPVDIGEVLEEVVELVRERPDVADRKLTLLVPRAPWPLPKASGDHDLLFLAIHNLVENAVKFTQPGDSVEVRAYEEGEWIVIEVADTGPGIPEDELPFVWEELARGKQARAVPGTGLGLALVRSIVHRHGGQPTIRSRVGQGTVVTVRLPQG
jgi:two-component system OmpR family sensor kinase